MSELTPQKKSAMAKGYLMGLAIGISLGTTFAISLKNVALGMGLGLAFSASFGSMLAAASVKSNDG